MRANGAKIEAAAAMFKVIADPARLRTLVILAEGEHNVGALAALEGEKFGTISARLKVLLHARLVTRRRAGKKAFYAIADHHVMNLVSNAIEHAGEEDRNKGAP